jgi:3-methyl-2-oxobutanoate hydroxymethyltransferase
MKPFTNASFIEYKERNEKITMMTAYDYLTAQLCELAGVDTLLVGDSLAMVVLGYDDTLQVTMEDMLHHVKAVRRGAKTSFVIADMPYMSYHLSVDEAVKNASRFIKEAGANAVKLEGGREFSEVIVKILRAQIPVIGHLGLTPQSVNAFGGYKVQAKAVGEIETLIDDALALEALGVSAIVLECIPPDVAERLSQLLKIPTIGIGAGVDVDGQVLVFHDAMGLYDRLKPKFVKQFAQVQPLLLQGLKDYCEEVKSSSFPKAEHTFKKTDHNLEKLY